MPDIHYQSGYEIVLEEEAILGECPACHNANVVLDIEGIGECEACDARFAVELIVRLSVLR